MKRRTLWALLGVVGTAAAALAATSASYILDPIEIDSGGEAASSAAYLGHASVGGSVIAGTSASSSYINDSAFLPAVETGTVTVPGLTVALGPQTPADSHEGASASDVPMLQIELTAGATEDVIVRSLRLTASGTGDDAADVADVHVYRDVDGDGTYSLGDVQIAVAGSGYASDNDSMVFTLNESLAAQSSVLWLVTYDFAFPGTPAGTETYAVSLGSNAHLGVENASAEAVGVAGAPLEGATVTMAGPGTPGSLTLYRGANTLPDGPVTLRDETRAVLQLRVRASSIENVTLESLRLTATGTGHDRDAIEAVHLYVDVNGDGRQDAGDLLVAGPARYSSDDGTLLFGGLGRTITFSSEETYVVVYRMAGTAVEGQTFGCAVADDAHVSGTGAVSSLCVNVSGAPVGSMIEIDEVTPEPVTVERDGGGCGPPGGSGGAAPWAWLLPFLLAAGALRAARGAGRGRTDEAAGAAPRTTYHTGRTS